MAGKKPLATKKKKKKSRSRTPGKASSSGSEFSSKRTSIKSKGLPAMASLEVRVAELRRLTALGTLAGPNRVYISAHVDGSAVPLFSTAQCAGGVIHQWPHGGKKFAVSISDVLAIGEGQKATFEVQGTKASQKKAAKEAAVTDASSWSNDDEDTGGEDDADAKSANDGEEEAKTSGDAADGEEGGSKKEKQMKKGNKDGEENDGGGTGDDDGVSSEATKAADSSAGGDGEEEEDEDAMSSKKGAGKETAKLNAASGRYGVFVPGRVNLTLLVLLAKGKKKKPNAKSDTLLGTVTWDLTREARRAKLRRPRMDGAFDIAAESANPFAWQPLEQPLKGKFAKDKFRGAYMTEAVSPELLCELSYHPPLLERRNALMLSDGASKVTSARGTRCERLNDKELRKVAQEFYREFDKRKAKSGTAVHRLSILLRANEEDVRSELRAEYVVSLQLAHSRRLVDALRAPLRQRSHFSGYTSSAALQQLHSTGLTQSRGLTSFTHSLQRTHSDNSIRYSHKGHADIFRFFPDGAPLVETGRGADGFRTAALVFRVPKTISLELSARGLRKSDLLSKSDPYVWSIASLQWAHSTKLARINSHHACRYVAIYAGRWSPTMRNPKMLTRTKTINNNSNPQWAPLSFKTAKAGDIERCGLTLVVRDDDGILNPSDDYLGSYFLEFEEMMEADALECELMYVLRAALKSCSHAVILHPSNKRNSCPLR